jgi:subtilisin family serine protease
MLHGTNVVDPKTREFAVPDHPMNWGLDRMDRFDETTWDPQDGDRFDGKYHYSFKGSGVEVFVLDTGVRSSHMDLMGETLKDTRVICGFDAFAINGTNTSCDDKVGHGTFMAGAIGGEGYVRGDVFYVDETFHLMNNYFSRWYRVLQKK